MSEEQKKKRILFALLVCNFAAQSLYMNVVALLPSYVNDNYPKLTSFDVGLLMSIYPFAYLATAPLIGGNIKNHGRKNTVLFGVIVMTLATLMFGMGGYCKNALAFYIVSFIARMF